MGNFYTNYTLRGPSQQDVATALEGRRAIVGPTQNGCVVAFDEASEAQDRGTISELASELSRELDCPVLAVLNHDDDVLWYQLHVKGKLAQEYNSWPGCFDLNPPTNSNVPAGGDAKELCTVFNATDVASVERVLRKSLRDDHPYAFAFQRHSDLVRTLGLPESAVGTSYLSLQMGEFPAGLNSENLQYVGTVEGAWQFPFRPKTDSSNHPFLGACIVIAFAITIFWMFNQTGGEPSR